MFKSPLVLGINVRKVTSFGYTVEKCLSVAGNNTGNLIFSEALFRVLRGAKPSSYHFGQEEVEGRDAIVIAAANWLNPYSDFGALAERLETFDRPVVIVGLGAQATVDKEHPVLKVGTERLIRLAADRSKSIAVRGQFSAEVLNAIGIKNVEVTGCPSLLLAGNEAPRISDFQGALERVTLHSTRHLMHDTSVFQNFFYREAYRKNYDVVLQSELADFYYALGRTVNKGIMAEVDPVVSRSYGDAADSVGRFLRMHGKVFYDLDGWKRYATTRQLFVGTRIHGTVIALLAGTPAILVAHDARTVELAEALNIPSVGASLIDISRELDLNKLVQMVDFHNFEKGYKRYREKFFDYFTSNGLELISG